MSNQTHGGKGDKQRPTNQQAYEENWERIFGKKEKPLHPSLEPTEWVDGEDGIRTRFVPAPSVRGVFEGYGTLEFEETKDAEDVVIDIINAQAKCT